MTQLVMHIRDICPKLDKLWWRTPHLVNFNTLLMVPFFTSSVFGYDGTMVNGIQTLPQWQEYFGYRREDSSASW
ncbi:hypothetical protein BJY00DRAFT_314234 [Aspergillus carlsbadensis]|nr:hypothetical protein BJY00DRAFT_314234 [Aspergillus carlsbadensis]